MLRASAALSVKDPGLRRSPIQPCLFPGQMGGLGASAEEGSRRSGRASARSGIPGRTRTCGLRLRKAVVGVAAGAWFLGFGQIARTTGYWSGYRVGAGWRVVTRVDSPDRGGESPRPEGALSLEQPAEGAGARVAAPLASRPVTGGRTARTRLNLVTAARGASHRSRPRRPRPRAPHHSPEWRLVRRAAMHGGSDPRRQGPEREVRCSL